MSGKPAVTIAIPAWNAAAFLRDAVESALAQTLRARIVISVDLSSDGTLALARELVTRHPDRLAVVGQTERLGFVRNSNAALGLIDTPFGMILPHDDRLRPAYVERALEALLANRAAVVACPDTLAFGFKEDIDVQQEYRGDAISRVERMVRDGMNALVYRGLLNMRVVQRHWLPDVAGGLFCDTLWMGRLAVRGEVIRVPEPLFEKRMHTASTHHAWKGRAGRAESLRWLAHVADLEAVLFADAPRLAGEPRIRAALRARALRHARAFFENPTPIGGMTALAPMLRARFERWRRDVRSRGRPQPL